MKRKRHGIVSITSCAIVSSLPTRPKRSVFLFLSFSRSNQEAKSKKQKTDNLNAQFTTPIASLILDNANTRFAGKTDEFTFEILSKDEIYQLEASNSIDVMNWITSINKARYVSMV